MTSHRQLIPNAPPWPGGAKCAVAMTFDLDADSILHLAHHKEATNLVASMSMLQYGPRVAMPRRSWRSSVPGGRSRPASRQL